MFFDGMGWWISLDYLIKGIALYGIGLNVVLLGMHITSIIYAKFSYCKKSSNLSSAAIQGVSILKPLKGSDSNLEHNLETFFNLEYPKYEILFCIEDNSDPAFDVVQKLVSKYPNIDTTIVISGDRGKKKCSGPNPKIHNLLPAYEIMKYNYFWICDSGIMVVPWALNDLVSKMTDKVALVHAMPCTANRKGFGSRLEKVYFSTQHSRIYISANLIGLICSTGMSNLIRKDYFESAIGGLEELSIYIAEDYFMSKLLYDNGYKLALASYPALQNSGNLGVKTFVNRMIRWCKLRISMIPFHAMMEPLSESLLSSVFFSWSCEQFFTCNIFLVFIYRVLLWFLLDYILFRLIEKGNGQMTKLEFLTAWLFRETLTPYIMLNALYYPTIHWRTGKFRLKCGGKVETVQDV